MAATCVIGFAATPAAQAASPVSSPVVSQQSSVTVETYLPDNKTLVSKRTYGADTAGKVMGGQTTGVSAAASGKGGSSSSSGCRRVTITNTGHTLLGFTAYKFHTYTRWCWKRSTQVISGVSSGWSTSDIDAFYVWRGIANSELGYYDYSTNDGHPRSAYKNYRQGHFENCVVKYGCIGNYYPSNLLRSYYNGTWVWSTGN